MKNPTVRSFVSVFALSLAPALFADDVTDSINEGLEAYKAKDYTSAAQSFEYAGQLVRQMKGQGLQTKFPDALSGWKAEEASSNAAGGAMFGGGVTASREYTKGDSRVTITIMADSPMLQSVAMVLNNPMFAAASPDMKMKRYGKQKAMVRYDKDRRGGEVQTIVNNTILVTFNGDDLSLEDLEAYVNAFKFDGLE